MGLKVVAPVVLLAALGPSWALAQDCRASLIFQDGFESGDTSAWGAEAYSPYDHVVPADVGVTLGVGVVGPVPTEVYTGSTTIDSPTTIENVIVDGCLRIAADGVTVRNTIIECGGLYPIKVEGGSRDFLIEYSRVDCTSSSKAFYFESGAPGAYVVSNEVIGCQDFFYIQGDLDGVVVADNYLHTLVGESTAHADGFQIGEASAATGAMQIRGNYIDPDNPEIGKTDIVFGTNFSEVDLLIENNYLKVWGHYTMRCGGEATRCTIRNNVYGPGFENARPAPPARQRVRTAVPIRVLLQSLRERRPGGGVLRRPGPGARSRALDRGLSVDAVIWAYLASHVLPGEVPETGAWSQNGGPPLDTSRIETTGAGNMDPSLGYAP